MTAVNDHVRGDHEGRHVDGCRLCVAVPPFVTVQISRELLAILADGWSPPVQLKLTAPRYPGAHWEMTGRTPEQEKS